MDPTVVFLLQICRRRERVYTHPALGDLLDNAEQDGDDNRGLEGLPEYNKEDRNGEHVRHVCCEDDDVREEGTGKTREEASAVGVYPLYNFPWLATDRLRLLSDKKIIR